jgi:hypothetical protein
VILMRRTPLLLLILCALPATARAQDPCEARELDVFASARRARRVVEDYNALHDSLRRDLDALDAGYLTTDEPPSVRVYGAPIADVSIWADAPTCLDGQRRDANLQAIRFGGLAGAHVRDLDLRLEVFWITGADTLDISIPAPDDPMPIAGAAAPSDVVLSQSQSLLGARVQLTRWAEVTLAQIADNRSPDPLNPAPQAAEPSRLYLALGVPALNLRTDLILDQRDQSLQTLYLDLNRLSIFDTGFALSARAGYLQDEAQVFTALGLAIPLFADDEEELVTTTSTDAPLISYDSLSSTTARLYPEVSVEWDDPRLRHARLRGEVQHTVLSDFDDREAATLMDVPYVDLGAFVEATTFHSRALEQRVDEAWAWGWGMGIHAALGLRLMSINLDMSGHLNRPETLAQVSELAGSGELRMLLSWRIGW